MTKRLVKYHIVLGNIPTFYIASNISDREIAIFEKKYLTGDPPRPYPPVLGQSLNTSLKQEQGINNGDQLGLAYYMELCYSMWSQCRCPICQIVCIPITHILYTILAIYLYRE